MVCIVLGAYCANPQFHGEMPVSHPQSKMRGGAVAALRVVHAGRELPEDPADILLGKYAASFSSS